MPSSSSAPGRSLYLDSSALFCFATLVSAGSPALPMNRIEGTLTSPWYWPRFSTRNECALIFPGGGSGIAFAAWAAPPIAAVLGRMTGMMDGGRRGTGPSLAVPGRLMPPPPAREPPPATESARGRTPTDGARLPPPNIPPVSAHTAQRSAAAARTQPRAQPTAAPQRRRNHKYDRIAAHAFRKSDPGSGTLQLCTITCPCPLRHRACPALIRRLHSRTPSV